MLGVRSNQATHANDPYLPAVCVGDEVWNDVSPNKAAYANHPEMLAQPEKSGQSGTGQGCKQPSWHWTGVQAACQQHKETVSLFEKHFNPSPPLGVEFL